MLHHYRCRCLLVCILTKDELEDIVEDKITPSPIWQELENLRVVHRSLFLVHLNMSAISVPCSFHFVHTNKAPVTRIRIPPCSDDGCESRVDIWCLTF